jgi:hypothetical protein
VEAGQVVILGAVAWVLIARGAALVGAGLLVRLVALLRDSLRETVRRGRGGALLLRLYLFVWLLVIAVWVTVFALLLVPPR